MSVLVAVGAGGAHVVELQRAVAAAAADLGVRAVQLETGRLVMEPGRLADHVPALGAVALGAVAVELAVRLLAGALCSQRQHRG